MRRMKLAGHCHRHPELAASELVLWQSNLNLRRRGRPKVDFVEVIRQDAKSDNRAVYSDGRPYCLEKPCDCSPAGNQIII